MMMLLAVVVSVGIAMLESFVAMYYWNWFVADAFHFKLTLIQWFAINMIVSLFCRHLSPSTPTSKDAIDALKQLEDFCRFVVAPIAILAAGFVIHLMGR